MSGIHRKGKAGDENCASRKWDVAILSLGGEDICKAPATRIDLTRSE